MTQSGGTNIIISADLIIPTQRSPDDGTAFVMRKSEWNRLKKKAEKIQPGSQWWSAAGSLFIGLGASCLVNWYIAINAIAKDAPTIYGNGYLGLMMMMLGIVCFVADGIWKRQATLDAVELLEEMNLIERGNPGVFSVVTP